MGVRRKREMLCGRSLGTIGHLRVESRRLADADVCKVRNNPLG